MYIETYTNAMPQNLLPHSVTKILLPSSRPDSVPQRSTHHAASVVWACTASDGFFSHGESFVFISIGRQIAL